jgi:hypothetical protein
MSSITESAGYFGKVFKSGVEFWIFSLILDFILLNPPVLEF